MSETTLSAQLTKQLRQAIINGEIPPKSKLSEPQLASQFQTSRGPVREAIRRLESMGLVQHVPHEGVRVIALNYADMIDMYHIREALEGKAAALAAQSMTDVDINALEHLLELHRKHQQTTGQYLQADGDIDFHYQIILGCKNQRLIRQLTGELYSLMRMYRQHFSAINHQSDIALREHEHIFHAIATRNTALAETTMRHHISRARRTIEQQAHAQGMIEDPTLPTQEPPS